MVKIYSHLKETSLKHSSFKLQKISLLFVLILMITGTTFSQITGKVIDKTSQEALEYATIVLYQQSDNSLVTGVVTNQKGVFLIEGIKQGTYVLEVSFIGYQSQKIKNIKVDQKNAFVDISTLPLAISSNQLGAVVLKGTAATVVHKIDRQVFKADKFQNSKGGNAVDVVKNLPSVTVNAQGDINVRGNNNFAVLLNGKPTQGNASALLSQLPANALEKVELITAPSAKYDPDGTAGILNIITKQGTVNGDYAQINVRGGFPSIEPYDTQKAAIRHGVDVVYNTRNDLWNFSFGANYQRNDKSGRRQGDVNIINQAANKQTFLPSDGERSFDDVNYNGRFTADYTPNKSDSYALSLFAGKRTKERLADITYFDNHAKDLTTGNRISSFPSYYNHNLRVRKGDFALASFDYTHKFLNQSKLSTSLLYEYTFLGGPTTNDNVDTPTYGTIYQQEYNTNDNPLNGMRLNVNYHFKSMDIGVLETGYQFRYLNHTGKFVYTRKNNLTGVFEQVDDFSSDIALKRIIHAAYLQLTGSKEKWDYAAGLRVESMDRTYTEDLATAAPKQTYPYNFVKLFPSASLQYKINNKASVKAAYSKRIARTTTFKMNSFAEREHSEVFEQGDNQLKPEFIDLVELGVDQKFKGGNAIYATTYFRHTKNVINRVNALAYEKDPNNVGSFVVNDSILNRVYSNVGKSNAIGLEIGATLKPTKNWSNFIGANIYNYAIDGVLNFQHRDGVKRAYDIDSKSTVYSFNLNSTYQFWQNASLQFALNYISDKNTAMGENSRFYMPNLTLKKMFFDDQLTATLQWQNIDMGLLKTNEQRITTWRPNQFYTTTNYVYEVDMVTLNLTYTFNKLKNKSKFVKSEFGKREF